MSTARRIVRLAALLVPADLRGDWRQEWAAELDAFEDKYKHRGAAATRRALGAFADAFWIRQRHIADFDWIDDLRHGWRQLVEDTGFAVMAVGILAIGLAASVAMFSVTDQVLLRPLPYPEPERIVTIFETRQGNEELLEPAPGNFLDWRQRAKSFETLAGADPWSISFMGGSRPEVLFAAKVTEGFFETFGLQPVAGRFFTPEEYQKGRDQVLVLHETFWRQRFGGDLSMVGKPLKFDDGMFTVVGIVPAGFEPRLIPAAGQRNVWLPKAIEEYEGKIRGSGYWGVVGRLKAGVAIETAQAELTAVSRQLAIEFPRTNEKTGARIVVLREHLVGNVRLAVTMLAGAVGLVLLIACVNVANLLLARGSARERELSIRVALGARRGRIVKQLMTESLLLAGLGGLIGTLLAYWALLGLARLGPATVPWIETLHLDWRAWLFAGGISIAVALLSGILPAWRAARVGLVNAGRQTATADVAQHRLRAGLVVVEVALALVLVSGAGLLIRSFTSLMNVDPGFQRDRVLVLQVFAWDHNPTPPQLRTFFNTTIARLASLPAVQTVGAVSAMPFIESNINIQNIIAIGGRPAPTDGEAPRSHLSIATPGYFEAMRIPLRRGRLLSARDGADTPRVAVISESLARRYWGADDDPIGDKVKFRFSGAPTEVEIVGVVASLRHDTLDRGSRDELFMALEQMPFGSMTFVIRTAGDPASLMGPAKAEIWAVSPDQTIYRSATLDQLVMRTVSPRPQTRSAPPARTGVALLLAIGGVYGVLSAITTARLREVGVRVALGASWWDIVRWVLARGLVMAGLGVAIGLAGSLGAAQLLRSFLFEIAPADPLAIVAAVTLMTLAALAACYLPARRAAGADPIEVLRTE